MDDMEEIFHEAVANYGGRLDTANLEPETAAGFDHISQRARGFLQIAATALPHMPPIHFDFVDSWQFNAIADSCRGGYFIGFFRGAVATLAVLFDRMLADPQVLPFIGNVGQEVEGLPQLPHLGTDFRESVASVPVFPRPQDPWRRAVAHKLTELAFDFLTAHEFAHIANGHLDYQGDDSSVSAMAEVEEPSRPPWAREAALIRQTMEMDADATAVGISLGSEWGKVTGTFPRPGPEWDYVYDRPGIVSLQWSWAVSSLFRLFGEARLTGGDVTREPYPRPRLRSVMVQQAVGQVPRPQGLETHPALAGDEFHNIPATIKAAHLEAEEIFSRLTGGTVRLEGLEDAWGDVGEAQASRLQDYWRTSIRDGLLEVAHQPLNICGRLDEEGCT